MPTFSFLQSVGQFVRLARADIVSRGRRGPALDLRVDHLAAGALHQLAEFLQRFRVVPLAVVRRLQADQKGALVSGRGRGRDGTLSKQSGQGGARAGTVTVPVSITAVKLGSRAKPSQLTLGVLPRRHENVTFQGLSVTGSDAIGSSR